ncbi:unnamed protein product [Echinostoma caproni]|uniref:ZP domain-containing protein n=1 Tax=Echinostoma caproni TaxID=27848 RepID=A0A183ATS9_9TREM|nr:unnamed protein product [Echinostoma caproni]
MLEKKDIAFTEARKICGQSDDLCAATNADTPVLFHRRSTKPLRGAPNIHNSPQVSQVPNQAVHNRRLRATAAFHVVNTIFVRLVDSAMSLAMHAYYSDYHIATTSWCLYVTFDRDHDCRCPRTGYDSGEYVVAAYFLKGLHHAFTLATVDYASFQKNGSTVNFQFGRLHVHASCIAGTFHD